MPTYGKACKKVVVISGWIGWLMWWPVSVCAASLVFCCCSRVSVEATKSHPSPSPPHQWPIGYLGAVSFNLSRFTPASSIPSQHAHTIQLAAKLGPISGQLTLYLSQALDVYLLLNTPSNHDKWIT
ncbi:hypothetical protein QBC42DRAFT_105376 [Cladorrhinum samala]|uniref:Uncharacterized protein n=1 Tax=Cladorrhinum samala TaxID=585594 RepID=A0AAV9HIE8_9PEZI|nr:hypothetical protein QBC42DRAFT_105376 [Cladorrhinum samala]